MQPDDETKHEEVSTSHDEKLDPRLAALMAGLPREMQPARDLWPGLTERLGTAPPPRVEPNPPALRRGATLPTWLKLAAATLTGAALGTLLTLLVTGALATGGLANGNLAKEDSHPGAASEAVPASFGLEDSVTPPDYRLVEADFLRARETLWLAVYARSDRFSPDTLASVEKSFASLDRAIQDLRRALEREPGNPRLEAELYRSHRRSLGLLRKLAADT